MRLLLFSDLHRDAVAAARLADRSTDFDVVVGAGDFATVHAGLEEMTGILRRIECPAVLVPGNSETAAELEAACARWDSAVVLHGAGATVAGAEFFGVGGGIPVTPFGSWSWDFTEAEARELLADCPPGAILVSHSPPKGVVDRSSSGASLGSEAVRAAILERRPRLVVCGHIHASAGTSAPLGPTPIVNAGPHGVPWNLEEA